MGGARDSGGLGHGGGGDRLDGRPMGPSQTAGACTPAGDGGDSARHTNAESCAICHSMERRRGDNAQ